MLKFYSFFNPCRNVFALSAVNLFIYSIVDYVLFFKIINHDSTEVIPNFGF